MLSNFVRLGEVCWSDLVTPRSSEWAPASKTEACRPADDTEGSGGAVHKAGFGRTLGRHGSDRVLTIAASPAKPGFHGRRGEAGILLGLPPQAADSTGYPGERGSGTGRLRRRGRSLQPARRTITNFRVGELRMSMFIGEALAGDGNEIAHIDLLIGSKDGPVGNAFANALARQSEGHSNLLAVLTPNLAVKPATVMITKVTIKGMKQAVQMFGPAQAAVAKAVADSVADGRDPEERRREPGDACCGVFIHRRRGRQEDLRLQLRSHQDGREGRDGRQAERRRDARRQGRGGASVPRVLRVGCRLSAVGCQPDEDMATDHASRWLAARIGIL